MATKTKTKTTETPVSIAADIRRRLLHSPEEVPTLERKHLDLGDRHLNSVLGDPDLGLFAGQIVEISGKQSNGKSALAYDIMATAQAAGYAGHWIDFERSFSKAWAARRGVKPDELVLYKPYVGKFGTEKKRRLITSEELLEEAEETFFAVHDKFPDQPQIAVIDSVGAILTEEEARAGLTGQNMRTNQSLPAFLGKLLRRWIAVLGETNTIAIFLNQLRTKPGVMFGDPDYTMGGNALLFYAHSRVRMRRIGGGRLIQKGNVVGIKGILRNDKNKAGGIEGHEIGYKILFDGVSKFMDADVLRDAEEKRAKETDKAIKGWKKSKRR